MVINNRSEEEQQPLNNHMRRKDVLEGLLFQSLHAEPASEEQVKGSSPLHRPRSSCCWTVSCHSPRRPAPTRKACIRIEWCRLWSARY